MTGNICIVIEFGVNLDQTALDLYCEMTWNFREHPCQMHFFQESHLKVNCGLLACF